MKNRVNYLQTQIILALSILQNGTFIVYQMTHSVPQSTQCIMSRSLVINESGNVKGSCHRLIESNIMEIPGRTAENHRQPSHSLCRDFNQRLPKYIA